MTFLHFLGLLGGVEGGAGEAVPTSGTHLSLLALDLPSSFTPAMAGLTVGAVVGVVGFVAVLLIVGRPSRRPSRRVSMGADEVVFIPPYAPPQAFATPGRAYGSAPFRPSTALSARAFAKMGYAVDTEESLDAPNVDPELFVEVEMRHDEIAPPPPRLPAVTISPVIMLSTPSSSTMHAAPIADLSFDDGPTEIGEPYFDEPPQPRRRMDPPKIRAVAPKGPRFPDQTPRA